ncbi:MAG: hypothetical protein FJ088_12275, partial [Deltaproteobacteria bacterium]|nr:hypothetical protein [Deltaproteobacteria bacterium]
MSPLPEVRGELSKFKLDQSSVEALKRLDDYLALVNNSDREAKDFADGVKLSLIAAAASKNDGAFLSQITKTDGNPEQVRKYLADQKPVDDGLKFAYSAAANLVFSIQQPYDAGIKVPLKEIESRFGAKPGIFSTIRVMAMDYLAKTYTDAAGMDLDKRDVFLKNSLDRFVEVENYQPAHNDFHLYHGFSLLSKLMKLPEVQGDPLSGYLGELKKASVEKLSNLYFTLKIPYLNIPDSVEDTKFRLNSRMGKATYSGEFTPLEVVYSGSDALFTGLRPVVSFKDGAVVFHYKEKGVLFPGVETFRAEKLKEIKDKEIPALKENIVAVSGLAAEIEKKVFPAAAEKGFANSDRADKKAIALAVDTMSPVDLLEAAMKSLQKLGYADFRLLRASEPSSFFPVLYKDTTGLPQDIKDGLKRKGIIILIREKSADIYPPEGKPAKTKDLPPMPEKAKPLAVKNLLYKVTVPYDAEKGFSDP